MLKLLRTRVRQGHRTTTFPAGAPALPDRFRGLPVLDATKCADGCRECAEACPTDAIRADGRDLRVDLGRCLFCIECGAACPAGAVRFTQDYRLATRTRGDLVVTAAGAHDDALPSAARPRDASPIDGHALRLATALDEKTRRLFGRSLKLRQVSAGGCNGCESDVNVLSTVVFDLGRFGIQFVASPRHADGLLITGPVTANMQLALAKTYEAVPHPKIVIAVGACAISGGPYIDHPEAQNGADATLPVDLYVPGCPPHPLTILDGLLRLLGKISDDIETERRI